AGLFLSITARNTFAAEADQAVSQADRKFVQAASLQNGSLLARMLDDDFTWTDADGKTLTSAEVLHSVPKPILGDESGIDITERTYGQVGAVTASRGKVHVLRMWVQRPAGWRLLVYHEVKQLDEPSKFAGTGVNDCQNPCKGVPFQPANADEAAIVASWQALETGVTAHDAAAWAPHIADEFVQISSNSDHPITKAGRMETLDKQKLSGVGSAPSPLVSAKMFDFGDAVIMTCLHQPYSGKPVHVSRLWIKRDDKWIMAISYQTTIQAGTPK
ncbi:MAG TPA: nuclear transport factor 2 family protein, partial [Candidatus Acidoferrum sp.]|nr:nuclear transport factor 2 family protein [Candidatus Acidoferrum sp.]